MKGSLPWFRFYSRFITDPDVEELSFEDQRHFVFVLCLKNEGLLDKEFATPEKRERAIARRLGLQGEALIFAKERLVESGLMDANWEPRSWDSLQFKSDSAAERQRRYRQKKKIEKTMANDNQTSALRNGDAVDTDTDTDTDTEKSGKGKRTQKNTASKTCPEDWDSSHVESWAVDAVTISVDQIRHELAMMRDHEFASPKKDWNKVAMNWLRRARPDKRFALPQSQGGRLIV